MQAHDIALPKQLVERYGTHPFGKLRLRFGSIGCHLHPETECNGRSRRSGMAETYHPDCLAREFEKRIVPETKVPVAHPASGMYLFGMVLHLHRDVQNMCKGELRHRSGTVGGNVRHDDSAVAGGLQVDIVVAGGEDADVFEFRERRYRLRRQPRLIRQQYLGIFGALQHFAGFRKIINRTVAQRLDAVERQVARIHRIAV